MALHVLKTDSTSESGELLMVLNKADGSGQKTICGAHAYAPEVPYLAASCSTLLHLDVGDQLWAVGHSNGGLHAVWQPFSSFQAYLQYPADTLQ